MGYDAAIENDREALEAYYSRHNQPDEDTTVYMVFVSNPLGGFILDYADCNEAFAMNAYENTVKWSETPDGENCAVVYCSCLNDKFNQNTSMEKTTILKSHNYEQ